MGFRELVRETQKVAEKQQTLAQEHAQTRGMVMSIAQVLRRGLLGRLKWIVLGR